MMSYESLIHPITEAMRVDYEGVTGICCNCSRISQKELGQQWSMKLCVSRVTAVSH